MRLTKTYEDGTYGVADDLPCGENSHDFKKLVIDRLGALEEITSNKIVIVSADKLEHLLNCMDNQKYIHEQKPEVRKEWQQIIDKANYEMRGIWSSQLPKAIKATELPSEAAAEGGN